MLDVAAVVFAYWARYRLAVGGRASRLRAEAGELAWAVNFVDDAARGGSPEVLALLDALVEAPEADLGYLGAGPVEDLLSHHGPRFDAAIAERCRRDGGWRTAVAGVWLDDANEQLLIAVRPFLPAMRHG